MVEAVDLREEPLDALGQSLLRHLLVYRGHQVRFEADSHTTEFGIYRSFPGLDLPQIKNALRQLESSRWIFRRVQYVIGYSEPKLVYSLTPNGYRRALDLFADKHPTPPPASVTGAADRRPGTPRRRRSTGGRRAAPRPKLTEE